MPRSAKTVVVDTCFWIALYDPRDENHNKAKSKSGILDTATLIIPWPSLYETFNTRFAKNTVAAKQFESLLSQVGVVRIPDEPYREAALKQTMASVTVRSMALVDTVIRLMLDDDNVRTDGILTFNLRDFSDICRKRQIEML